jgi:hypothetical protein
MNDDFFKGCTVIGLFSLTIALICGKWTDSNLEFWLSHFKGEAVEVPYWISFVTTLVLNGAIIVINILAELFKFIL